MTTIAPSELVMQQGVSLPRDVEDFLQTISKCCEHRDIDQLMRRVSHDFLHQGMEKRAFEERLRQSYLIESAEWLKITLLHFERNGNIAEVAGFAETNLGVISGSCFPLPIIEGSKLGLVSGYVSDPDIGLR